MSQMLPQSLDGALLDIAIGDDLRLIIQFSENLGESNDAGETFDDKALDATCFDSDWNYLGCVARLSGTAGWWAPLLPSFIDAARTMFPANYRNPDAV